MIQSNLGRLCVVILTLIVLGGLTVHYYQILA
jgi:hypothetical protein